MFASKDTIVYSTLDFVSSCSQNLNSDCRQQVFQKINERRHEISVEDIHYVFLLHLVKFIT